MTDADAGTPRHHRPVPYADLESLLDIDSGEGGHSRSEVASATASAVLAAGRAPDGVERLLNLADTVGIDTLADLWRDSDPVSLPGALWTIYLLRQWCHSQPDEVSRLWRAGAPYAPAEAVVAGVDDTGDGRSVRYLADDVLSGAYQGDFAVALERAAAFFRVMATGRRETSISGPVEAVGSSALESEMAERNDRTAATLTAAAAYWRAGQLH